MAGKFRNVDTTNDDRLETDCGHALHVFQEPGDGAWFVWLNTEVEDFDGLILGYGDTREAAVASSLEALEKLEDLLQSPLPSQLEALLTTIDRPATLAHTEGRNGQQQSDESNGGVEGTGDKRGD